MKRIKKYIAVIVTGVLCLSGIGTSSYQKTINVLADDENVVVALTTDQEVVKAGDTLQAILSVKENDGIAGLTVRMQYDTEVLSLVSVSSVKDSAFEDAVLFPVEQFLNDTTVTINEVSDGIVGFSYVASEKEMAKGDILIADFSVKEKATVGKSVLSYEYLDASDELGNSLIVEGKTTEFTVAPIVNVKPQDEETEKSEATSEVAKLIEDVVSQQVVKGIAKELAAKIVDAINQYKEVKVELSTDEMEESDVSQETKEDIAKQMGEEEKVAAFFDIDLSVRVEGEEIGTITEIEKEIEVTLPIPEKLPEREKRVRRMFYVLRVHDNVVEKLAALVAENGIVFKTDRFSTYVLTYEDRLGKLGDVNSDERADIADALMISRYDARLAEMEDEQMEFADVNEDGEVNIADALMISRYDAGLIERLE